MKEPFLLWRFYDAPEEYQAIHGYDDCDWILVAPKGEELPYCINDQVFGCCAIEEETLEDGRTVYTGRHA